MNEQHKANGISVRPYFHSPFLFLELIKRFPQSLTELSCGPRLVKSFTSKI